MTFFEFLSCKFFGKRCDGEDEEHSHLDEVRAFKDKFSSEADTVSVLRRTGNFSEELIMGTYRPVEDYKR